MNRPLIVACATILLFVVLTIAHFILTKQGSLPLLVGNRSEAIFDLWSIQHFCAGIIIGQLLIYCQVPSKRVGMFVTSMLLISLTWEASELFMEAGGLGEAISQWKKGFEHWSNRLISDPLLVTSGGLLATKFKHAWKIVLVPVIIWLLLTVLSSDSMYVQDFLLNKIFF